MSSSYSPARHPDRQTWLLIVVGLIIHVGFAGLLTLSVDEAHYALYAQHLDLSYFDHPPLVGWIQWPLVAINAPDWVLRLIPQILWFISALQAWSLSETLRLSIPAWRNTVRPGQAGRWAVLMLVLGPVFHVLSVGLLPDSLLIVLVLGMMQITLGLCRHHGQGPFRWLLLGLLLGLAGLSKYTAVLFALAVAGMLWINLGLRVLATTGPWITILIAAFLVSPVFYWNATHDWISFNYQIAHSSGGQWQARRLLAFIGLQIVAFGPLVIAAVIGTFRYLRHTSDRLIWGLWLFFLIPFAVTLYMSGGGRTLPHWMAPVWLAAIVIGANPVAAHWNLGKTHVLRALAWTQGSLCTLAFVALFFIGLPFLPADHEFVKKNPLADLWGWNEAGQIAQRLATEHNIQTLSVGNWTLASRLAWYAKPLPVIVLDERYDQFDIWFGQMRPGQDAIFVNWTQVPYAPPVGPERFQSCQPIANWDAVRLGRTVSTFEYLLCQHWQGS